MRYSSGGNCVYYFKPKFSGQYIILDLENIDPVKKKWNSRIPPVELAISSGISTCD